MRRMSAGGPGRGSSTESDSGAGPATSVPPSIPAPERAEIPVEREEIPVKRGSGLLAGEGANDERETMCAPDDPIDGEGVGNEIIRQYGRMLAGIRRLPRGLRPLARRQARDWMRAELKGLKERLAMRRRAARQDQRNKMFGRVRKLKFG